jgi:acetyl-CoA acetyltransferase
MASDHHGHRKNSTSDANWRWETGAGLKVNRNGGAIAIGDPLSSCGTQLMATLLDELERANGG